MPIVGPSNWNLRRNLTYRFRMHQGEGVGGSISLQHIPCIEFAIPGHENRREGVRDAKVDPPELRPVGRDIHIGWEGYLRLVGCENPPLPEKGIAVDARLSFMRRIRLHQVRDLLRGVPRAVGEAHPSQTTHRTLLFEETANERRHSVER